MSQPALDFTWSPSSGPVDFVIGADSFPPTADARFNAEQVPVETIISFTAETNAPQLTYFEWDFGDGERGFGQSVKHSYQTKFLEAQVTLRAFDTKRQRFQISKMINLHTHDPLFLIVHESIIPE